jgi:hypothetical protein
MGDPLLSVLLPYFQATQRVMYLDRVRVPLLGVSTESGDLFPGLRLLPIQTAKSVLLFTGIALDPSEALLGSITPFLQAAVGMENSAVLISGGGCVSVVIPP